MPPAEPACSCDKVLIVAESGRAIAQAAHRAGFAPLTVTAHRDADLLEVSAGSVRVPRLVSGIGTRELAALAAQLAPPPIPLVYGGVMEARPGLLRRLAQGREVLGVDVDTLTALLHPIAFAERLRRLRIPHPPVTLEPANRGNGWLVKKAGGCGGTHVRAARPGLRVGLRDYGQRRVRGRPVSVLVAGDGSRAVALGASDQWPLGSAAMPFVFTGVIAPAALDEAIARAISDAATALAAGIGLRGLGSVDCIVDRDTWHVLEINPRIGGSLDAWTLATGADLFRLHVEACRGHLPAAPLAVRRVGASRCVFAPFSVRVPWQADPWPAWVADRPLPGTVIRHNGPVCTVLAEGSDRPAVLALLERRAQAVLADLVPTVRREGSRRSSAPPSNADAARASAPDAAGW